MSKLICIYYDSIEHRYRAFMSVAQTCEGARRGASAPRPGALLPGDDPDPARTPREIPPDLLQAATSPFVGWIEVPCTLDGTPDMEALLPPQGVLIGPFPLPGTPDRAPGSMTGTSEAPLASGSILAHCPSWLISPDLQERERARPLEAALETDTLSALGRLAAGVAHELANPLSVIRSSLQYLHQGQEEAGDPACDFTLTALSNVDRMQGLLRSMLDFASGKEPLKEEVDLREIISEVLRFTAAECARRSIVVDVFYHAALPRARVDPPGLKQILLNLVKNGLDAMGEAGGTLNVRARPADYQATVLIEIANDGPPIPEEVRRELFRPFHTTKSGGTGLGLYLSREIAREHGGDLQTENRPEGGVRFTLTLPLETGRYEVDRPVASHPLGERV